MVLLLVISIYPIIWYVVLTNHSNIHSWFTYRICAITLLSIININNIILLDENKKTT